MENGDIFYRYRVKFSRVSPAGNMTHIDYVKSIRAAVSSSGLEFIPMGLKHLNTAKVSFGPALTLGYDSTSEYADIYLKSYASDKNLQEKISAALPEGITVSCVKRIPYHFPSVEALVNIAEYEATTEEEVSDRSISNFLNKDEALLEKQSKSGEKKVINIKPFVLSIKKTAPKHLNIILTLGAGKTIKAEYVLEKLGIESSRVKVLRKELYWKNSKGEFKSP